MLSRLERLTLEDIQSIDSPDSVAELFQKLGYPALAQPLALEDLDLPNRSASAIEDVYLIADYRQSGQSLQILLFQLNRDEYSSYSLAKNRIRMIANSLLRRPSHYLLLATKDYRQLLLGSPHQTLDSQLNLVVNLEACYIDCANPSFRDRNWLEKLAVRQLSPQILHTIHYRTLRSAAIIQQSSEEYFTEDSIQLYLREIGRIPLLTAREEIELARKVVRFRHLRDIREELKIALGREPSNKEWASATTIPLLAYRIGLKARNRLISANLRLVVSIAKRYQGRGLELMDLVQEGSIGLVRAAEKFDPERGNKFSTYATWWIRQGVIRAIANQSRLIRLPVHVNQKLADVKQAVRTLSQELERRPTEQEVADQLEISRTQLQVLLKLAQSPVSLDVSINGHEDSSLGDVIESHYETVAEVITRRERREGIEAILNQLKPRERDVLRRRYGFDDGEEKTLAEIGRGYGLTRERVRQIEAKAMQKLNQSPLRSLLEDI
jgi:RNA polymerase primary sigma factor